MAGAWPTRGTRSRRPRTATLRTQNPVSALWKVTRSTVPAIVSAGASRRNSADRTMRFIGSPQGLPAALPSFCCLSLNIDGFDRRTHNHCANSGRGGAAVRFVALGPAEGDEAGLGVVADL